MPFLLTQTDSESVAIVLDPRLNIKKLRCQYASNADLKAYLEVQIEALRTFFDENYPESSPVHAQTAAQTTSTLTSGYEDLAAFMFGPADAVESDELNRYFECIAAAPAVNPVEWWYARKAEFPRLYRLARDIMTIPGEWSFLLCAEFSFLTTGSAVAVERVFSGG